MYIFRKYVSEVSWIWEFLSAEYYSVREDTAETTRPLLEQAKVYLEDCKKPGIKFFAKEYPRVLMLLGETDDVVEQEFIEMRGSSLERAEGSLSAHLGRFYEEIERADVAIESYINAVENGDPQVRDIKMAERGLRRLTEV